MIMMTMIMIIQNNDDNFDMIMKALQREQPMTFTNVSIFQSSTYTAKEN